MKILRRLVLLIVFVAFGYGAYRFAGANGELVSVDLFFLTTPPAQQWLVLLSSFGLGALAAAAFLLFELAKMSLVTRRYRKAVRGLESEIHELRNLPLATADAPAAQSANARDAGALGSAAGTSS